MSTQLVPGFPILSSFLSYALIVFSIFILILAVLLYSFQTRLIYIPQLPPGSNDEVWQPSRFGWGRAREVDEPESGDWKWENVELKTADGKKLACYWIRASSTKEMGSTRERNVSSNAPFTVIYLQANAGNIGHRLPLIRKLQEYVKCNVFMLSYRGYGRSTGSPSEKGIQIDSKAAMDWVWSRLSEAEKQRVAVYGQSIGGAVAISMAATFPDKIRYVMVENTFLSIPRLIPVVAPVLRPFAGLCHQKWNSASAIKSASQRILFLVGERDELIPPAQMFELQRNASRARERKLVSFAKGTHNDTCIQPGYFDAIADFLYSSPPAMKVEVEEVTDDENIQLIK